AYPTAPTFSRPPRNPSRHRGRRRGALASRWTRPPLPAPRSHSPPNYSRSLPVRLGRADLDRTAVPQGRGLRCELQRGVEIIALEDEVGADRLLDPDIRSVGDEGLAVLGADRGRVVRQPDRRARRRALGGGERLIASVDLLLLAFRKRIPLVSTGHWSVAAVDQQYVLHRALLVVSVHLCPR